MNSTMQHIPNCLRQLSTTPSTTFPKSLVRAYSASVAPSVPPSKLRYIPTSGTYPKGFLLSSAHAGVKPSNTKYDDVCLLVSETPAAAAATFTTNKFQAAPVRVSREVLAANTGHRGVQAIVINSGCANAVTGRGGVEDAWSMVKEVERLLSSTSTDNQAESAAHKSLVMSTGVIGQRLPLNKILHAIPTAFSGLGETHEHWLRAARAICTTDTFPKLVSQTFKLPGSEKEYCIAGMTKGAGMIHPNMATLLGIICTDAPVAPEALHPLLKQAVDKSFNSISIDGDTSTNDTVALLANGAAGGPEVHPNTEAYTALEAAIVKFSQALAQLVVRDGEGATKFVRIRVENAKTLEDAKKVASTIARSPLVKTALYGRDANWGRILCATGYAEGVSEGGIIPEETSVSFIPVDGSPELKLLVKGEPENVDEERAAKILESEDLEILVKLSETKGESTLFWTCDFSHEYVTINGDYRT